MAPLNVPSLFNWVDEATNTSAISLFHALGYGRRRQLGGKSSVSARSQLRGGRASTTERDSLPSTNDDDDDDGDDDDDVKTVHVVGSGGEAQKQEQEQVEECFLLANDTACADDPTTIFYTDFDGQRVFKDNIDRYDDGPVSYTHLTLPTIYSV